MRDVNTKRLIYVPGGVFKIEHPIVLKVFKIS